MMLIRYWFKFEQGAPSPLNLGCGITAYDEADARAYLERDVFPIFGTRSIAAIEPDIDIQTLDQLHVMPNMRSPVIRGVWFPQI